MQIIAIESIVQRIVFIVNIDSFKKMKVNIGKTKYDIPNEKNLADQAEEPSASIIKPQAQ